MFHYILDDVVYHPNQSAICCLECFTKTTSGSWKSGISPLCCTRVSHSYIWNLLVIAHVLTLEPLGSLADSSIFLSLLFFSFSSAFPFSWSILLSNKPKLFYVFQNLILSSFVDFYLNLFELFELWGMADRVVCILIFLH